jgi:hypothetical protein
MKKVLAFIAATICSITGLYAQQEFSSFTATGRAGVSTTMTTDYQSIGINPANMAFKGRYKEKSIAIGFLEVGSSIHSRALTRSELAQSTFDFNQSDFDLKQKLEAAKQFADNPLAINLDAAVLGFSIQLPKIGAFGFTVRDRFQWYSRFSTQMSDIVFAGYNSQYFDTLVLSNGNAILNNPNLADSLRNQVTRGITGNPLQLGTILDGARVNFSWVREYNFSYANKVLETDNLQLMAGVGFKYIQGFAGIDIRGEAGAATLGYASLSPAFGVSFGDAEKNNPNKLTGGGLQSTGTGFGADFGLNLVYKEKLKMGFSVTNLGSMTWKYNLYDLQNSQVIDVTSNGFENYNIFTQAGEFTGDEGIFNWTAAASKTVALPTLVRAGASLLINDLAEVGVDVVMPANQEVGSFERAIISAGGDLYALPWLRLSSGFTVGGNLEQRLNMPIGVTFVLGDQGSYEAGIASRDVLTYFLQDGPTLSVAFGFLRFRL